MAGTELSQAEADALIALRKHRADDDEWDYPAPGRSISVPLVSEDRRESFLLDVARGRIDVRKGTCQTRARQVVVLVRLDFGGSPHRNPDGQEIPCPHVHLYREGFADKWAEPAAENEFPDVSDAWRTLQDFMRYCNVVQPPGIRRTLFT